MLWLNKYLFKLMFAILLEILALWLVVVASTPPVQFEVVIFTV